MLKKVTKGLLRKTLGCVRLLKNWAEGPVDVSREATENSDLAYPWLNSLLTEIHQESPSILRPNYAWGVLQAAHLAKALGMKQVSVIEFGVAGGNGLVALDQIAEKVEAILDVNIHVYGFDTGVGLPKPTDYRDLPSLWVEGAFPMDVGRLKKRLTRAELVLVRSKKPSQDFWLPIPLRSGSFLLISIITVQRCRPSSFLTRIKKCFCRVFTVTSTIFWGTSTRILPASV